MMGEQVPESFIMSQLLGFLLPSAKQPRQDDVPGTLAADYFKQDPDFLVPILQRKWEEELMEPLSGHRMGRNRFNCTEVFHSLLDISVKYNNTDVGEKKETHNWLIQGC